MSSAWAGLGSEIAIIGYGYRLPGGMVSDDDLWKLLSTRGFVQEPVGNRYGKNEMPHDGFDSPGRTASLYEGLITDGEELAFDCALFGMSPNDAKRMDPQIKMMLMATWEALECAGLDQTALHNSNTGVFTGQQVSSIAGWKTPYHANAADVPGKSGSMIANRISYHFNWMGPSYSVATACSSGITALDAAIESLSSGKCDLAATGAVNYLGHLASSMGFNQLGIISKTGTSRSFDKDANGYMRAEGAFVYLIKRLPDAQRDGDKIFAVIRGCGLNTAGAEADADVLTQGRMIVAPVGHAQRSLMRQVAREADIDPAQVSYVEAHATGTAVGDAIEGNAIAEAYGSSQRPSTLRLGSMRSNVGHMEAASFTASLLKVLLMMQRRMYAPISGHFRSANPKIPWEGRRLRVQTECESFPPASEGRVLVGINSFGFGGANGHCILEEYLPPADSWSILPKAMHGVPKVYSVPLSAKSEEALVEMASRLAVHLGNVIAASSAAETDGHVTPPLAAEFHALVGNLSRRTTQHRVRTAFAAASMDELKTQLEAFVQRSKETNLKADEVTRVMLTRAKPDDVGSGVVAPSPAPGGDAVAQLARPTIVFVFPGQGSQWAGCGKSLYETEPTFKRVVDAIDQQWLKCGSSTSVMRLPERKLSSLAFDAEAGKMLNECECAQPVTFLLQVGLFELLKAHGIHADAVVGHSAGEAASAYASGAYTLEEATQLVYDRATLQQRTAGCGRMLVLMMTRADVEATLTRLGFEFGDDVPADGDNVVDLACFNSPGNTVVCGAGKVVAKLQAALEADGLPPGKLIPGSIAFHSRHMEPIKSDLLAALAPLDPDPKKGQPRCGPTPLISTVTGRMLDRLDANYWWWNVRRPVNLLEAMRTIHRTVRPDILIEISPHITLRSPIRDIYADGLDGTAMPPYIHTLIRNADTAESFAHTLGQCFKTGAQLDPAALYPRPPPITYTLPRYPIKKERMIDDLLDGWAHIKNEHYACGPLLGKACQGLSMQYEAVFSKPHYTWMADHVVQETPIVPAAGYIELILEACGGEPVNIVDARFLAPFTLSSDPKLMHTHLEPCAHAQNRFEFTISSRPHSSLDTPSTVHCTGTVEKLGSAEAVLDAAVPPELPRSISVGADSEAYHSMYPDAESFYANMGARMGTSFGYGPHFRVIQKVERNMSTLDLRVTIEGNPVLMEKWDKMGYVLHPTILDGVLQIFIVYLMEAPDFAGVPQQVCDFCFVRKPTSNKLTCTYQPPEYLRGKAHQKGQLAVGLGERSAGCMQIYDGVTGALVAYLGTYITFQQNFSLPDLRRTKHYLSWQPKGCGNAPALAQRAIAALGSGEGVAAAAKVLVADMVAKAHPMAGSGTPFFTNAGECLVGDVSSDRPLALEACLNVCADAPVQFTSMSHNTEALTALYNHYGTSVNNAHLRFVVGSDAWTGSSMLRPAMFEMLVVRLGSMAEDSDATVEKELTSLASMLAPGGLMLVEATSVEMMAAAVVPAGFSCLYQSPSGETMVKVLVAPERLPEPPEADDEVEAAFSTRVVVDDAMGFSEEWRASLKLPPKKVTKEGDADYDFSTAVSWTRVDYFATLRESDSADSVTTTHEKKIATGDAPAEMFDAPAQLIEWVRQFAAQRSGQQDAARCVFTVFTKGAVVNVSSPSQTGVWGAVRTLSLELGDECNVDFRVVDLGCKGDLSHTLNLEPLRERELAVHNGQLWTSRLINLREDIPSAPLEAADPSAFRLHTDNTGAIADLQFRTVPMQPLGPDIVEISVKGAALNFRDIMVGLGRLPLQSYERSALGRTVGIECAGVIERVGSAVTKHKVGDRVLAMQGGCVANRLRCTENQCFTMPSNVSFEQGCSLLSVYVTAYYGLIYLARMRPGQTILVHSAMGGVGQAAIALAKHVGASVIGTAGSKSRREKLLAMGCMAAFDSHSTAWYADVMKVTGKRGVDICLNSLAGEHVDLCLEALAPGGWHCEIGKVDIYNNRPLKMAVFRKNVAYRAIDIDRLMMDDPSLAAELTTECLSLIDQGKLPPLPITCFEYAEHQAALRSMMGGLHEGKIVLTPPPPGATLPVGDLRPLYGVGKADGGARTVLLSGCLGDFGLRLFAYVIAMGATNILVLDRDKKRKRSADWMRQNSYVEYLIPDSKDVRIEIVTADVAVYPDVTNAIAQLEVLGMPPLGSVFHLAGILDDKFVSDMDRSSFAKVYAPKADGAWNLHRATLQYGAKLDHFVMLSSTSSAFGNPGQTNYSAANSVQDGLAAMRRQQGLAGLAYCMGAVVEAGMAARNPQLLNMMKMGGMPAISSITAIEVLDSAIRSSAQHYNAVCSLATDRFCAELGSSDFLRSAGQLVHNSNAFKLGGGGVLSREALIERISAKVAPLCGVAEVGVHEPLSSYGLNSISVAELGAFLKTEMAYSASTIQLLTSATCESIADGILAQQGAETAAAAGGDGEGTAADSSGDSGHADGLLSRRVAARTPSRFALGIEEHFASASMIPSSTAVPKPSKPQKIVNIAEPPAERVSQPVSPPVEAPAESTLSYFGSFLSPLMGYPVETKPEPVRTAEAPLATQSTAESAQEQRAALLTKLSTVDGTLPAKIQETLDDLLGFVSNLPVASLAPACPVASIKRVMLTGATGFVGRHFLAYLLGRTDVAIEMIYCPVRAADDDTALARVVEAMTQCCLWSDAFRSRMCVFAGDLAEADFGASAALCANMQDNVDAIYHFASNLKLAAPFSELKECNCEALKPVMKLGLSGSRLKHLFHASTLGIFPQYFCQFGNEFASRPISQDAMPAVADMKRIYPLTFQGYPWTKFINELVVYRAAQHMAAHGKTLPLAVFRLPYLFSGSKTGYTVSADPTMCLFQAILQTRVCPSSMPSIIFEDLEVVCATMLNVTLNPQRQHVVYHCSRQSQGATTESPQLNMLGYHAAEVSYASFKAACQKVGKSSPLHLFWPLFDHYAPYWFENTQHVSRWPIDDATVRADCHPLPDVPDGAKVTRKSFEWCFTHQELWPFDVSWMHATLTYESMLGPCAKLCEAYQLDFDVVVPPFVRNGLRRLCDELDACGHIKRSMRPDIAFSLQSRLESRVHLHKLFKLHPEIYNEPLDSPLFILGLNRTGTTALHRMLEASGAFAAPHLEEHSMLPTAEQMVNPDPVKEKEQLAFFRHAISVFASGFEGVHELEVGMAEEDMCAHAHAFTSLEYDVTYDLPKYRQWLEGECVAHGEHMESVYAEHRVWMQMVVWRRRRRIGKSGLRWCFKMPWHVRSLPALLNTYPDAIIVHTHRPLMDVAGSWCSLVEKQRENFVENAARAQIDRPKFAQEQLEVLASMLLAGAEWRAEHPEVASRWLDVQFSDLVQDPGAVIASVAKIAGVALNSGMCANIEESVRASVAKHKATSRHSYTHNDHGLDGASMPPYIARVLRLYERGLAERAVAPESTDITGPDESPVRVAVAGQGLYAIHALRLLLRWLGRDTRLYLVTTNDLDTAPWTLALCGVRVVSRPDDAARLAEAGREYNAAIAAAADEWKLRYVVPACEEAFYISADLLPCEVLAPPLTLLRTLHDKFESMQLFSRLGVNIPCTELLDGAAAEIDERCWVVKPVFCRAGLRGAESPRSVRQRRCHGAEFASLSLFVAGRLVTHCCYRPSHTSGAMPGFYMVRTRCADDSPEHDQSLRIAMAVSAHCGGYQGFLGLDLMEPSPGAPLVPIECNPRPTSGCAFFFAPHVAITYSLLPGVLSGALALTEAARLLAQRNALSDEGGARMVVGWIRALVAWHRRGLQPADAVVKALVKFPAEEQVSQQEDNM